MHATEQSARTIEIPDVDTPPLADREAIARWLKLEDIARKEPSLPVFRPRTRRARELWARVDAEWRALLAEARAVPGAGGPIDTRGGL